LAGAPLRPGATGNVATENIVYMLQGMGIATGVAMAKLVDATNEIGKLTAVRQIDPGPPSQERDTRRLDEV
jgi:isopropylmalate/homocitrate/citramalate synthase